MISDEDLALVQAAYAHLGTELTCEQAHDKACRLINLMKIAAKYEAQVRAIEPPAPDELLST